MDTTTTTVLATVVVMGGQWAKKGKGPSIKQVVGGSVLALMLAGISNANEKLGQQFALLILTGAVFIYAVPIAKKLGYSK